MRLFITHGSGSSLRRALLGLTVLVSACAQESTLDGNSGLGHSTGTGGSGSGSGSGGTSTGGAGAPSPAGTGGAAGGPVAVSTGGASSGGSTGGSATGGSASSGAGGSAGAPGKPAGSGGAAGSGAPPASGTAGSSGSAASGCAGKTYKFCEDFESGTAGGLPTGWTAYQGYGAGTATDVGLATDQAHSGHMALKSNSASSGQKRAQHSLSTLGATATTHWGRVFYKVQSPPPTSSGVLHVTWVGLHGGNQENRVVDIVESNTRTHQWLYNNPDDKGSLGSAYSWNFDSAWHCAEWYIDVSTKSYRFFSDGAEVKAIGFTNKADSEMVNYTAIIVGATFYQMPASAWIMWFDDLAIDDNQIGCQ